MVDVDHIPTELYTDLEALRPILERQGVVQYRQGTDRRGMYRLRFREFSTRAGFTLHRSMSLGYQPAVAEAVAVLIRRWQDEFQASSNSSKTTSGAQTTVAPTADAAREAAQAVCGGGWRRRQQIGEWFDQAVQDPAEMLRFTFTGKFPTPRKAGRPPKKRLW
jgi:hypothetical protein